MAKQFEIQKFFVENDINLSSGVHRSTLSRLERRAALLLLSCRGTIKGSTKMNNSFKEETLHRDLSTDGHPESAIIWTAK